MHLGILVIAKAVRNEYSDLSRSTTKYTNKVSTLFSLLMCDMTVIGTYLYFELISIVKVI